MSKMIQYTGRILLILCIPFSLWAQETDDEEGAEIQEAEIIIEKDREIKLGKETKLYEVIKYQPENAPYELPEQSKFKAHEYGRKIEPTVFDPPTVSKDEPEENYRNFIKAGYGNFGSPILDVSLLTPESVPVLIGLNYKHLSFSSGEIDNENSASSFNEISTYALLDFDKVKVKPYLSFTHDRNYFFGYPEGARPNRGDIKRSNSFFNLGTLIEDNWTDDTWGYSLDVNFENFSDNYSNKENTFNAIAKVEWDDRFNFDSQFNISKYNTADSSVSRAHYRLLPYYEVSFGDLDLDLGISVNGQNDEIEALDKVKIFPYVHGDYVLSQQLSFYATLDAGYDWNTLSAFSKEVRYLNPNLTVQNTQKDFSVEIGVSSSPIRKLSASARVRYQQLTNFVIFINDFNDQSFINAGYDDGRVNRGNLGITADYELLKGHDLILNVDFYSYDVDKANEAYHLPTIDFRVKGHHTIIEDLTFQWQFSLLSGIRALDVNTLNEISLDPITKLDLMAHYQVVDKVGAFVSIENVLSQNYSRYLFYPQRGIMFKIGGTYRF